MAARVDSAFAKIGISLGKLSPSQNVVFTERYRIHRMSSDKRNGSVSPLPAPSEGNGWIRRIWQHSVKTTACLQAVWLRGCKLFPVFWLLAVSWASPLPEAVRCWLMECPLNYHTSIILRIYVCTRMYSASILLCTYICEHLYTSVQCVRVHILAWLSPILPRSPSPCVSPRLSS